MKLSPSSANQMSSIRQSLKQSFLPFLLIYVILLCDLQRYHVSTCCECCTWQQAANGSGNQSVPVRTVAAVVVVGPLSLRHPQNQSKVNQDQADRWWPLQGPQLDSAPAHLCSQSAPLDSRGSVSEPFLHPGNTSAALFGRQGGGEVLKRPSALMARS